MEKITNCLACGRGINLHNACPFEVLCCKCGCLKQDMLLPNCDKLKVCYCTESNTATRECTKASVDIEE